jgi:ABC-2 type transport system ATP-binding protein
LSSIVTISNLNKVYKSFFSRQKVHAVKDLNLEIYKGEVFGLLGPNGSGKTTTIKLMLGLLFPTTGQIRIMDEPAGSSEVHQRIGYLPEESYLYRFLNADEILNFYGKLFGIPKDKRLKKIDELIERVGLSKSRKRPLKSYSKGMMRRIGIAQALINEPEFIILDEPTSGLDPIGSREVKDLILKLKLEGKTVLLCSHLLSDVEDVCDRISIMYEGKMECLGKVSDLLSVSETREITIPENQADFIQQMVKSAHSQGISLEVKHPRRKLEDLFMEIVRKNKN